MSKKKLKVKDIFGKLKTKTPTEKLLKEIDRELGYSKSNGFQARKQE